MRPAIALPLSLVLALLCACTGKARLLTETRQIGSSLEVKVDVEPPAKGTLTFKGNPAFEKLGALAVEAGKTLTVDVPLAGIPKGKNSVSMEFTGEGRGAAKKVVGKDTLSFERTAITPGLKLVAVPKPGVPDITCRGDLCDPGGTKLPFGPDAKLSVDLTQCDGCDVDVGGQKISVRGPHAVSSIDLTNAIANASGSGLADYGDMKVPFKITLEGETTEAHLDALPSLLAGTVFRRVLQGPVAFAGDRPAGSPKAAVIVRKDVGYGVVRTVGAAPKVRDYDLIGIATPTQASLGTCGVYTKSDTKAKVNVAHMGVTFDVTMYDRRTAKTLGRHSFPPVNESCGEKLVADVIFAYPADAAMDAWARTFLK